MDVKTICHQCQSSINHFLEVGVGWAHQKLPFGALALPMHSICQALTELALSCSFRPGHWNIPRTFWNQQKHKYIKTNQQLSHAPWTFQNLSSLKKRYCLLFTILYTYSLSSILLTQGVSSDNKQHPGAWKPSLQLQGSWKQPRPLWSWHGWHGTRGQTTNISTHYRSSDVFDVISRTM